MPSSVHFCVTLTASLTLGLLLLGCQESSAPGEKPADTVPVAVETESAPEDTATQAEPEAEPTSEVAPVASEEEPTESKPTPTKPSVHLRPKGEPNRLAKETSPYLLMHKNNPVDWYAWGPEAFAKAKKENKPVFLSIGYSSCYWCHVMERESFMNDKIAAYMNEHFVCIKVDREERPDVDEIYMSALQAMTQRGGWPLSMFMTPEAEPIVGGTYFPPNAKNGLSGFTEVLRIVHDKWTDEEEGMREQGKRLAEHLRKQMLQRPVVLGKLRAGTLDDLMASLEETYDAQYGGFGFSESQPRRPKFPEPSNLVFLLDRLRRDGQDKQAEKMLLFTLEKMAGGGIRDHFGGGFHRYSTDRFWRIPHFEKMLYDNGQLASVYAEAYTLSGRESFRRTTQQMLDFVLRELTDELGGFYSALDAETNEEEGQFYVWTGEELREILTPEEFALAADVYGFHAEPNFEGHYAALLAEPLAETAKKKNVDEKTLDAQLEPIRKKLLAVRDKRPRPLTDTKILTAWNGLMIAGMADAGRLFEQERYTQAAAKAADFVLAKLRTPEGRLLRTYGSGQAKLNGYLDDYAFLVQGLIALHRATGDKKWLTAADALTAKQVEWFWDERGGGFFFTSKDHETLIVRSKDPADGALPAGNSVAAGNLLYLAEKLNKPEYRERGKATILAAVGLLERAPAMIPRMATALAEFLATEAVEGEAEEEPEEKAASDKTKP